MAVAWKNVREAVVLAEGAAVVEGLANVLVALVSVAFQTVWHLLTKQLVLSVVPS